MRKSGAASFAHVYHTSLVDLAPTTSPTGITTDVPFNVNGVIAGSNISHSTTADTDKITLTGGRVYHVAYSFMVYFGFRNIDYLYSFGRGMEVISYLTLNGARVEGSDARISDMNSMDSMTTTFRVAKYKTHMASGQAIISVPSNSILTLKVSSTCSISPTTYQEFVLYVVYHNIYNSLDAKNSASMTIIDLGPSSS